MDAVSEADMIIVTDTGSTDDTVAVTFRAFCYGKLQQRKI